MECKDFTHDVMLDHSERLLDPRVRQDADNHLNGCRACRERYEEIKKIAGVVRRTLQAPAHKALMEQLESSVMGQFGKFQASRHRVASHRRVYWAVATAAAAAIMVAVIVGVTWKGPAQSPPSGIVRNPHLPVPPPEPPVPEPPKPEEPKVESPLPPKTAPMPVPKPPATESPKPEPPKLESPKPEPPRPKPQPPPEEAGPVTPKPQPPEHVSPVEPALVRGDSNRNGKLDLQDANFLDQEILAGRIYDPATADLNGDGRVDCGDVLAILQAVEKNP